MPREGSKENISLIKKAMKGNSKAFGELVRQERAYLYRIAFIYTRQESDALDAVQESVLKAYLNIKSLREPHAFRSWITRICINTATAICKKRKLWEELETISELPSETGLSPEEKAELHAAIERLPEKYREIVRLKYFEGFTTREIAQRLKIPEGTVSSSLNRAIARLRQELKEETICQ